MRLYVFRPPREQISTGTKVHLSACGQGARTAEAKMDSSARGTAIHRTPPFANRRAPSAADGEGDHGSAAARRNSCKNHPNSAVGWLVDGDWPELVFTRLR